MVRVRDGQISAAPFAPVVYNLPIGHATDGIAVSKNPAKNFLHSCPLAFSIESAIS
jgi:hypothetical protein